MKIIGLTGGIACGKSTVAKILRDLGAIIIDADKISRDIMEPKGYILQKISNEFGKNIINEDGSLNRKMLGDIVFNDKNKLNILNSITHNEIKKRIYENIENIKKNGEEKIVVIDAPLLIETNLNEICDEVWIVNCRVNTQIDRLIKRNNFTYEEAIKRIGAQMSYEEKLKFCDKVIDNNNDIENTKNDIFELWNEILNSGGKFIV